MAIKDYLKDAVVNKWALGHFNFSEDEALRAIVESAVEFKTPVFVGTSEGERKHIGVKEAAALVKAFREEFSAKGGSAFGGGIPVFLNADHTKTFEGVKEAVDAGYDAVLADFSALPFEENLKLTKQSVEYAKSKNPGIIVEGELGYVRGDSKLQKVVEINPEDLTKPEEAARFARETGIDMLAPAVGNIHGIVTESEEKIDIARIAEIKKAVGNDIYLVLHGGSGLSEADFKSAIEAGVSVVHINTEIRVAFTEALKESLAKIPDETTPYKILAPTVGAMKKVIEEKLKIFGSVNKI
ncbi:class II fructose-bisphosphate aldolase family protein [Candidatus Azambacteria bacterium]|nr:class II fructose-bisphosphate aldolase family protein [Candidatus Azambacteria bacterium]